MRSVKVGPTKCRTVSKIRRTKVQAYGTASDWSTISKAVIARDGNKCRRCGCTSAEGNRLNAHHIIRVSQGGRTIMANLKTLCHKCHSKEPGHGHMRK
jgi:5-methylcytosine-specific restriction endonuclease McrA